MFLTAFFYWLSFPLLPLSDSLLPPSDPVLILLFFLLLLVAVLLHLHALLLLLILLLLLQRMYCPLVRKQYDLGWSPAAAGWGCVVACGSIGVARSGRRRVVCGSIGCDWAWREAAWLGVRAIPCLGVIK